MHSRSYDVRSGRSMVGARGTRPPLPLFWLKNRIAEVRKADRARDKKPGKPPPPLCSRSRSATVPVLTDNQFCYRKRVIMFSILSIYSSQKNMNLSFSFDCFSYMIWNEFKICFIFHGYNSSSIQFENVFPKTNWVMLVMTAGAF